MERRNDGGKHEKREVKKTLPGYNRGPHDVSILNWPAPCVVTTSQLQESYSYKAIS